MKFWQGNPYIVSDNRLKYRSSFMYYNNIENALVSNPYYSNRLFSLNGNWYLNYYKNYTLCKNEVGEKLGDFKIEVPSNLEILGFGKPKYTQTTEYGFESLEDVYPPYVPEQKNPCAVYTKKFILPNNFNNKRIVVCFNGVDNAFYLYINGKYV